MIYKIFRAFEFVFGRKEGIKAEMTSYFNRATGKTIYQAHSLEAALTLIELGIRKTLKFEFQPFRIYLPKLSTVGLPKLGPYLFAIGFDAVSDSTFTNPGPATQTHIVTGSNPFIMTMSQTASAGGASDITGIDFNGSAFTKLFGQQATSIPADYLWYWYLANSPTGSHTLTTSTGSFYVETLASSYSGVVTSSPIDASGEVDQAGATALTNTLTASTSNCWFISGVQVPGTNTDPTSSDSTKRVSGNPAGVQIMIFDQSTSGTGSKTMTITPAATSVMSLIMGALVKPFVATGSKNLPLMGVGV